MIRTVVAAVDDMFFVSKIRETAKALGMVVKFPRSMEALRALVGEEPPGLIIVDLHNQKLNPIELATHLRADDKLTAVPLLGFFSHVEADLQRQALEAGYNEVIPRSIFASDAARLIRQRRVYS